MPSAPTPIPLLSSSSLSEGELDELLLDSVSEGDPLLWLGRRLRFRAAPTELCCSIVWSPAVFNPIGIPAIPAFTSIPLFVTKLFSLRFRRGVIPLAGPRIRRLPAHSQFNSRAAQCVHTGRTPSHFALRSRHRSHAWKILILPGPDEPGGRTVLGRFDGPGVVGLAWGGPDVTTGGGIAG